MSRFKGIFLCNRRNLPVHIEDFAFVEAQAFDDIQKRVRMHSFFECLTQQILTAFGVRHMLENGEHKVVANQ